MTAALVACGSDSGSGPTVSIADTLFITGGNLQTAGSGTTAVGRLRVRTLDANNAPAPGVVVTWSVVSGSASFSSDTSTTNATGDAVVPLQMGLAAGPVVIHASAPNVPFVEFHEMNGDPCVALPAVAANDTVPGDLWPIDCKLSDQTPIDFYGLSVATPTNVTFTLKSGAWEPYIFLFDTTGFPAALTVENTVGDSVQVRALLAPGQWIVGANTYDATADGSYALRINTQPLDVTACSLTWLTRGATVQQTTGPEICQVPNGTINAELFLVVGEAGRPITWTAQAAGFAALLEQRNSGFGLMNSYLASGPGQTATINFTPATSDFYWIVVKGANGASLPYQVSFH